MFNCCDCFQQITATKVNPRLNFTFSTAKVISIFSHASLMWFRYIENKLFFDTLELQKGV